MPDLIEKAPADAPAAPPVPAAQGEPIAPAPPKARPPVDLDARLEEVLTESRRLSELDKQIAQRLKRAEEIELRWKPRAAVDEHLTKGERAAAVKALFEGKIDEDLLFELAKDVGIPVEQGAAPTAAKQLSIEDQVKAALEAREKIAAETAAAKEKERTEADQRAAKEQMDTFLTGSATYLKTHLEQFPFIAAWGCDTARYTQLLIEHAEKTGLMPDPAVLLAAVEAEHKAKWAKSPYAPKEDPPPEDLDAHVARTYQENRPATPTQEPQRQETAYQQAKRELDAYDREQRERVRYHVNRGPGT